MIVANTESVPILGYMYLGPTLRPPAIPYHSSLESKHQLHKDRLALSSGVLVSFQATRLMNEWQYWTQMTQPFMSWWPLLPPCTSQCSLRDGHTVLLLLSPEDVAPLFSSSFAHLSVSLWSFESELQHQLPRFPLGYLHPYQDRTTSRMWH